MSGRYLFKGAAIEHPAPAIAILLCCGLLHGCGSPAETKVERTVTVESHDPPAELLPAPPYSPHPQGTLSFNRDISQIIFTKCTSCHRPDEIGPFPLQSYADVKKRAKQIVEVTQKRAMPPWSAVPGYCAFQQERSLSSEEIGTIAQWADEGAPEGNALDLPPLPEFASGWKFGEPDLVVRMPEAYTLSADVKDTNRKFVIQVPIEEAKYVKGWDFDPGNTKIVHHAILTIDQTGWPRHLDEMDSLPGYDGTIMIGDRSPDGFNLAWLPGSTPPRPDENLSWRLEPGTSLVLELHLCGTGKAETEQASIALYFASKPPTAHPGFVSLFASKIDILPRERAYVVRDEYVLPVDTKLTSVRPHAHFRGKDVQVWAVRPNGAKSWLLRIQDWDFNWQSQYTYAEPFSLPKGTLVCMQITYDNSDENPRNPTVPSTRVRLGRKSSDEMGEINLNLLLENEQDASILRQDYGRKYLKNHLEQQLFLNKCDPDNAETHYNLGADFQAMGDLDRSAHHYEASIRIDPNKSWTRNNLGSVYRKLGRTNDAVTQYNAAIRIDPSDARAHNNLGLIYLSQGDLERASALFNRALTIKKDFVEAEYNLGGVALQKQDFPTATTHFERVLRLNPHYEPARAVLNFLKSSVPASDQKSEQSR